MPVTAVIRRHIRVEMRPEGDKTARGAGLPDGEGADVGGSVITTELITTVCQPPPPARTAIDGGDGSRYTSDDFSQRGRKVVNPHTWAVCAKIAKIRRGKRQCTQNGAFGVGHHPTQADTASR